MGPLLDARIQSAKASIQLSELLEQLKRFNNQKEAEYGLGDIRPLLEAENWRAMAVNMSPTMADYMTYTIPLQFMTILDPYINTTKINRLLLPPTEQHAAPASSSHDSPPEAKGSSSKHILAKFGKLRIGKKKDLEDHESRHPEDDAVPSDVPRLRPDTNLDQHREADRLWPMFSIIFKDYESYDDLVSPVMMSDLSSYFDKMVTTTATHHFWLRTANFVIETVLAFISLQRPPHS
jgi:hypothetical protein